jgi:hypothetical protein
MSPNLTDTDYSVSVTEAPQLTPDGSLEWIPVYFDIRNGAQGVSLIDGVRDPITNTWSRLIPFEQVTEQMLRTVAPDAAVDRLLQLIKL